MLAFFIVSSMDLLDCLDSSLTKEDRERYIDWVYLCQHRDGGFRGFPGGDLGHLRNEENAVWDPANVPATFFALAILAILKDGFSRVKRRECLIWLKKMQRPDGSFGETLGLNERIEGGLDPRFGYTAMGIRAILRGRGEGEMKDVPDVDVDLFVECIRRSQVRLLSYSCRQKMLKVSSVMTAAFRNHRFMSLMVCSGVAWFYDIANVYKADTLTAL